MLVSNKRKVIYTITTDATFIAIIALMTFVPNIGFINIPPFVSFTLIHIPVLIGAALLGWKRGLIYGFVFGLCSLIKAAIQPAGLLDPYFIYPWISILPRMIFGVVAGLLFDLVKRFTNIFAKTALIGVVALFSTILHTVLVALCLFAFYYNELTTALTNNNYTWLALLASFGLNGSIESGVAFVIVPLVSILLFKLFPNLFYNSTRSKNDEQNV